MKRSVKSNQRQTRLLGFRIEGSTGTISIEGLDANSISVVDTGVGTYTITFNKPFAKAAHVVASCEAVDKCATVDTISATGCVIKVNDIDETAALSDGDVQVLVFGSDVESSY